MLLPNLVIIKEFVLVFVSVFVFVSLLIFVCVIESVFVSVSMFVSVSLSIFASVFVSVFVSESDTADADDNLGVAGIVSGNERVQHPHSRTSLCISVHFFLPNNFQPNYTFSATVEP